MENSKTICPVCTLYLREGITLQAHLGTHPKEQVIEALLKVSNAESVPSESSEVPKPTGNSYTPMQTFANSHSSIMAGPYANPQTQMTTAVTYQHFVTSNGSTIMPQYIQIPTVLGQSNNVPVIPNQGMNFIPNQAVNYAQTLYNPLYNPYIPQPYPFSQPVYTSFPVSALPPNESNAQTESSNENLRSVSTSEKSQEQSTVQPSVLVNKRTVATNTVSDEVGSKSGSKKSTMKGPGAQKKKKMLNNKLVEPTNTLSVIKIPVKTYLARKIFPKRTVIRTIRPKTSQETPNDTGNLGLISPPPLTPSTGKTKNSISGSKTPPPPPLSKAPYFASQNINFIKKENVPDCSRPHSTPAIIFGPTSSDVKYFEPQKLNSVIVESNTVVQNNSNDLAIGEPNNECCDETLMESVIINKSNENIKEHLSNENSENLNVSHVSLVDNYHEENENENEDEDEDDENLQKEDKIFQMIEVGEESKIDITKSGSNQDLPQEMDMDNEGSICSSGSKMFIQDHNIIFNEGSGSDNVNSDSAFRDLVDVEKINLDNKSDTKDCKNQTSHEYELISKGISEQSFKTGDSEAVENREKMTPPNKISEPQPVIYTDLQPAKGSIVFRDLGLTPTINLSSFMEVDGIKIFFNNNNTVSFDPINVKIAPSNEDVSEFMKTENPPNGKPITDSVIQMVSGNTESKNEFTFGESYTATTSHAKEHQLDRSDLSPLALNIQADESMPARGELSEQESLGAENSTWNQFHRDNLKNLKTLEDWSHSDNAQSVAVIGSKRSSKLFKCSICNEVFSCPKERRVHKNTVHMTKVGKDANPTKKSKTYACTFCSDVFTALKDRKLHVLMNHFSEEKIKKNIGQVKEEMTELEALKIEKIGATIKNETVAENDVKTETTLPSAADMESQRVKYCSHCSLPFVGVKKLREHLRLVHGDIRFKCESCSKCFDEESEYNDHLLIHPLACEKCGKTFHKRPNLNLHMKRHLEVKPYECTLCPKSFVTRQKLEEHMNGHSGKKPLKCSLCDKTFSRHSNLIQHRNLHHLKIKKKIKDFVCRCGEVFHSLRKLEWHKEVHEPKPKPCPFCSQKFIHSASVTRHIRRAHLPDYLPGDNREYDNVQCPICEKVYLRSSLMVHMRVHNGEKPFACKVCNKRFSTKWNLELHNWTHQSRSNMPFKCHICKGAFFREPDFVAHLNAHRNYKPFTCNICGQKFVRKYSCLRHQEEHKKKKQFVCAVSGCTKSFHRGYYLRDHMKVHTGVRPHTCHICGKASSTKSNHNKHLRIHDTREPVNTEN